MEVQHDDPDLQRIENDVTFRGCFDIDIARQFRRVMLLIRSVPNESELYKFPSRHFEKLKGDRQHQHSLRLNQKWRLIVEIAQKAGGNCVHTKEITNHYQ